MLGDVTKRICEERIFIYRYRCGNSNEFDCVNIGLFIDKYLIYIIIIENRMNLKQQDIIKFWRDIEIFNFPDFNKEAYLLEEKDSFPWLNGSKPQNENYKWRYTLIFGKIDKKEIVNYLNILLEIDDVNDWEVPITGFSCFSSLVVDESGYPSPDTYIAASYIFGLKALENKLDLSTIVNDLDKVQSEFLDRYNFKTPDGEETLEGDQISWGILHKEIVYLKEINKWWHHDIGVYILRESVPKDSESNSCFLNSFYLDDLNYLSSLKVANFGEALKSYLTLSPEIDKRKDLIENKDLLFESLDPKHMTIGRWPSNIEYGLYSAQCGAVNTIFTNLRTNEGLQGVNGPPGTGKTTLLKDVVAQVILERAKVISELGCDCLFETGHNKIEKESGYTLYTYTLKSSLRNNFGIVVSSNNNAAVENISKELPLKRTIDIEAFPDADFFSDCSQSLIEEDSWGGLAAALGNMANRTTFRKCFWDSDKASSKIGFNELLSNSYIESDVFRQCFNDQNNLFKNLLHEFDHFKEQAGAFHKSLPMYIKNRRQEEVLKNELTILNETLSELELQKTGLSESENIFLKDEERIQSILNLHLQRKPLFFFFQKLFSTNAYKSWNVESESFITKMKDINITLSSVRKEQRNNLNKINQCKFKQETVNKDLSKLDIFFSRYEDLQKCLYEKYGIDCEKIFDIYINNRGLKEMHLLNPYHSPTIAKLRSEIFLTALNLHKNAILFRAKEVRNNLKVFFEMLSGWVTVKPDIAQNLWDTFFLCVPVVSTTLASVARLFPNLDKNQIGWLLIDEAGQATPQSAAGIIHRSKRCVIVGDPLQVEPVITVPEKLVTQLRKEHNIDIDWSPYKSSVQQLADRVSLSGTYMQVGSTDERVWTGFPLRTHRRCDNPMFSIANEIAYSNQMVKAVNKDSSEEFIGRSSWFHVECDSTPYNKHVIIEEINLLKIKIAELRQIGYQGNIYVISPFNAVANYCLSEFQKDKNIFCGTIHKFQGKEADIVFLVLGSNPVSSGARNWASQKPNMLNVALTRAKKRFYVIGNKNLWGNCNYFNVMARSL